VDIFSALLLRKPDIALSLLHSGVASPNEREDETDRTPIIYAAEAGYDEIVRLLIVAKADVNAIDRKGMTALHLCCRNWHPVCGMLLLEAGANVAAEDVHGNTPLHAAAFGSRGRGELIVALLARGADPHRPNKSGISPLTLANTIANFDVKRWFAMQ